MASTLSIETVTSNDGSPIALDRIGRGPAVVLIGGGPTDRRANSGLAAAMSDRLTVFNYDRRAEAPAATDCRRQSTASSKISQPCSTSLAVLPPSTGRRLEQWGRLKQPSATCPSLVSSPEKPPTYCTARGPIHRLIRRSNGWAR